MEKPELSYTKICDRNLWKEKQTLVAAIVAWHYDIAAGSSYSPSRVSVEENVTTELKTLDFKKGIS